MGSAKRLLEIENNRTHQKLDEHQAAEWRALVVDLFHNTFESRRKSFRIPVKNQAKFNVDGNIYRGQISHISHIGLTVLASFPELSKGCEIVLLGVENENHFAFCKVTCKIVNILPSAQYGLSFNNNFSLQDRQNFFDNIYYPLYIAYLKQLASVEDV